MGSEMCIRDRTDTDKEIDVHIEIVIEIELIDQDRSPISREIQDGREE